MNVGANRVSSNNWLWEKADFYTDFPDPLKVKIIPRWVDTCIRNPSNGEIDGAWQAAGVAAQDAPV
ncbi:MAG: hypothetical protein Kow0074_08220 [Candidatus Zixiibacteriota bacterium]